MSSDDEQILVPRRLVVLADSLLSLAVYRREADTPIWQDDAKQLIAELRALVLLGLQESRPMGDTEFPFEVLEEAGRAIYRADHAMKLQPAKWESLNALIQLHYRNLAAAALRSAAS